MVYLPGELKQPENKKKKDFPIKHLCTEISAMLASATFSGRRVRLQILYKFWDDWLILCQVLAFILHVFPSPI